MRILHVITSLDVGGAERSLKRLIEATQGHTLDSIVICLTRPGAMSQDVESLGVQVEALSIDGVASVGPGVLRLKALADKYRPDLIQGWMYHGNLAATLAAAGTRTPVVWNIRTSLHRPELFKFSTRILLRLGALASRHPDRVIYNSTSSLAQHIQKGFRVESCVWIPNGVPRRASLNRSPGRASMRRQLNVKSTELLAVSVGRLNVVKGYDVLLRAIEREDFGATRFAIVGRNIKWTQPPFREFTTSSRVRERLILRPETQDVGPIYDAADFLVSPSLVEAFPNVVAEAMDAALPCVATDVGDVRQIVGDCGIIVPAGDTDALSEGIRKIIALSPEERAELGARAQERVQSLFSDERCHQRYESLYQEVLKENDRISGEGRS